VGLVEVSLELFQSRTTSASAGGAVSSVPGVEREGERNKPISID
jgi:hypothetical protein